jgi:competence protein ComEA
VNRDAGGHRRWLNLNETAAWGLCFCGASLLCGAFLLFGATGYAQQTAPTTAATAKDHPQYSELPAGPGKDTLIRVCGKCHSPDNVLANGQDRTGWENTITKMAGFGAVATDDEFSDILDYLAKNFPAGSGTTNVNKATATQLETGLGLSAAEAEVVIQYRKTNGDFKSIDDLKKVPDVDAKKLDAKKAHLAF